MVRGLWSFVFILAFFGGVSLSAHTPIRPWQKDDRAAIIGEWRFIGYIFQDQFQDPPNPNLVLTFEFFRDGTDILHWHRIEENGFCERKGRYTYDGVTLRDEIVWVNPDNSFECQRDPDMMLGRKQVTPLRHDENHLFMDLPLSDYTLTYVWERESSLHSQKMRRAHH